MNFEEILLSDMFMDNDIIAECSGSLPESAFTNKANAMIYKTLRQMYSRDIEIDPVTVANTIGDKGLQAIGGVSYLTKVMRASPGAKGWKHHLKIVKENAEKLALDRGCKEALKELEKGDDIKSIIDKLQNSIIQSETEADKVISMGSLMEMTLDAIDEGIKNGGKIKGITTGYRIIDNATGGFNKGDLMIIAARPSMGKTAFILNMMNRIPKGYNALLFELEMSEEKLGSRLLASETGINPKKISRGQLDERKMDVILPTMDRMSNKDNLYFDCRAGLTLGEVRAKAKKIKIKYGLDVIFIDHIGKIKPDNPRSSRNDQIGQISNDLKNMAKDLEVCVVALSQLNRGVEQRTERQPMMSDLRDSGNIEQDADQIMMLYRDDYYEDERQAESQLEVFITKNRDGEVGKLALHYDLDTQRIKGLEEI